MKKLVSLLMAALISLCCTAVSFGAHGEHEKNVCYCNHNYVFSENMMSI